MRSLLRNWIQSVSLNTVRRNKREFSLYSLLSWIFRASAGTRAKMDRSYRCRLISDSGDGDSSYPSSALLLLLRTASGLVVGVDGGDESPLYVDRAVATRGGLRCTRGTNGVQSGNSAAATTTVRASASRRFWIRTTRKSASKVGR